MQSARPRSKISFARWILHLIGKNSNFSRISCTITTSLPVTNTTLEIRRQTWISLIVMNSTEQWVLAMKSASTPKAPAHRGSPTMLQAPIESLHREPTQSESTATDAYQQQRENVSHPRPRTWRRTLLSSCPSSFSWDSIGSSTETEPDVMTIRPVASSRLSAIMLPAQKCLVLHLIMSCRTKMQSNVEANWFAHKNQTTRFVLLYQENYDTQ